MLDTLNAFQRVLHAYFFVCGGYSLHFSWCRRVRSCLFKRLNGTNLVREPLHCASALTAVAGHRSQIALDHPSLLILGLGTRGLRIPSHAFQCFYRVVVHIHLSDLLELDPHLRHTRSARSLLLYATGQTSCHVPDGNAGLTSVIDRVHVHRLSVFHPIL